MKMQNVVTGSALAVIILLATTAIYFIVAEQAKVEIGSHWIARTMDPWSAEILGPDKVVDVRDDWVKLCTEVSIRDDNAVLHRTTSCQTMRREWLFRQYREVE